MPQKLFVYVTSLLIPISCMKMLLAKLIAKHLLEVEPNCGFLKSIVATIVKPQFMVVVHIKETLSLVDNKGGSNICLRLQHQLVEQSNTNPLL